ncbi:hypothetical protein GCM10009555_017630 [Acrocarpospora macrocephala]|uniref:Uncharacterized protein n=1 Tax=Acrocarpospora macrocephala TaxID=150177 RepID=A0A5M3WK48_9ACTN|nr:hypothetical protein [Acrocarpospora macrocephala]GES07423.1 hypothetical protein Amac_010180 [Acrocarpospora macrocephala]
MAERPAKSDDFDRGLDVIRYSIHTATAQLRPEPAPVRPGPRLVFGPPTSPGDVPIEFPHLILAAAHRTRPEQSR